MRKPHKRHVLNRRRKVDIGVAGGPYGEGMLVVQDGHKLPAECTQNFKLVPWRRWRVARSALTAATPPVTAVPRL